MNRALAFRALPWAGLVLGLAGLTLWVLGVAIPTMRKLSAQHEQIQSLQARVSQGIAARAGLPQLHERVARYQIEVSAFEQQVPRQEQLPDLVGRLNRLALQHEITLQQVSRTVTRDANRPVTTTRIPVVARGKLQAVYGFWRALLAQGRYLNLGQPNLSLAEEGNLEVRFDLLAYTFLE